MPDTRRTAKSNSIGKAYRQANRHLATNAHTFIMPREGVLSVGLIASVDRTCWSDIQGKLLPMQLSLVQVREPYFLAALSTTGLTIARAFLASSSFFACALRTASGLTLRLPLARLAGAWPPN